MIYFIHHNKKEAKFLLCTHEIKVGDKVRLTGGSNNDYSIKFEDEIGYPGQWYKIIGEISLDAIVTDGQLIEEDEWRGPIINRENFKARYFIQIKDKDGNFK